LRAGLVSIAAWRTADAKSINNAENIKVEKYDAEVD
jgi:hypothetical protein